MILPLSFDSSGIMEIPRHWRLRKERLRMEMGYSCGMCGQVFTQDRPVCPQCGLHFESGQLIGQTGQDFANYLITVLKEVAAEAERFETADADALLAAAALGDPEVAIEVLAARVEA